MICRTIAVSNSDGVLDTYIQAPQFMPVPRPAVIVVPGGGYNHVASREGEPIAVRYLNAGFQAFVLRYSVSPAVFPTALCELAAAAAIVREHSSEWGIDPNKIFVIGFSAGGHLAASLANFWNRDYLLSECGLKAEQIRPNGLLLCYPVITNGEHAHRGSFECLLKGRPQKDWEMNSLENQVSEAHPPVFMWHTLEDQAVPVENSLLYLLALKKKGIPVEYHLYPKGNHGLSLGNEEVRTPNMKEIPPVSSWMDLSITWIRNQ